MGVATVLVVNGIDATTGAYLLPPSTEADLCRAVLAAPPGGRTMAALQRRHRSTEDHLGPGFGVDEANLAEAGWGVVFASADDDAAARAAALGPLLERRRDQTAARSDGLYREFAGDHGYRSGESKDDFLRRLGAGPGPVRPHVVPFYLLLVGGPDQIPFEVQYQLSVQHAVGRLAFDDVEAFARYAENVVAAETRAPSDRRTRLSVFAPCTQGDRATELSSALLAEPLVSAFTDDAKRWDVTGLVGEHATKTHLLGHLSGSGRPDILLTASHGIGLPLGHPQQRETQGALVCQDWSGPGHRVATADCFGATDLGAHDDLDLTGMIAVCFACFGGGTPRYDGFPRPGRDPAELTGAPFVAALPQTMLGREKGALAFLGHVDRAWGFSFVWPGAGGQSEAFRSLVAGVGAGLPLGAAMRYLTDRHAELATELASTIEQVQLGRRPKAEEVAGLWVAYADARGFALIGDPAVSLSAPAEPHAPDAQGPAVVTRPGPEEVASAELPPRTSSAVEVATYVSHDPLQAGVDRATGRITGADLALLSRVELDGDARHVVANPTSCGGTEADLGTVAEVHARLLEVSIAARRAWLLSEGQGDPT